ncbi:hypothetical protein M422DRAFT_239567 [Sphaerobolus stellatus SS14]|nr:hypothetical protein M422DRAFT_239567 [Sphaerobolus stellatus SS14]
MGFAHPCLLRQLSFLDAGFPPSPTSLPSPPPPSSQDLSLREKTALHDIGRIHPFFHSSAIAARTLWKDHTRKAYQSSLSSLIVSYKQSPNPKFKPKPTCDTESRHIPNRYRRMRHSCLCMYKESCGTDIPDRPEYTTLDDGKPRTHADQRRSLNTVFRSELDLDSVCRACLFDSGRNLLPSPEFRIPNSESPFRLFLLFKVIRFDCEIDFVSLAHLDCDALHTRNQLVAAARCGVDNGMLSRSSLSHRGTHPDSLERSMIFVKQQAYDTGFSTAMQCDAIHTRAATRCGADLEAGVGVGDVSLVVICLKSDSDYPDSPGIFVKHKRSLANSGNQHTDSQRILDITAHDSIFMCNVRADSSSDFHSIWDSNFGIKFTSRNQGFSRWGRGQQLFVKIAEELTRPEIGYAVEVLGEHVATGRINMQYFFGTGPRHPPDSTTPYNTAFASRISTAS